jgi:hypothetical protein
LISRLVFSFGGAAGYVVAGAWLVLDPDLDHGVQRPVELSIAVPIESIPGGDLAAVGRVGAAPASIANTASE